MNPTDYVVSTYVIDENKRLLISSGIPNWLKIIEIDSIGYGIIVLRDFKKDEIIYSNKIIRVINNDFDEILMTIGKENYKLSKIHHGIADGPTHVFGGFEELLNHSCLPNVYINVVDEYCYTMNAAFDIDAGTELRMNYNTYLYETKGCFECKCGLENCMGYFRGYKYLNAEQRKRIDLILDPWMKEHYNNLEKNGNVEGK